MPREKCNIYSQSVLYNNVLKFSKSGILHKKYRGGGVDIGLK